MGGTAGTELGRGSLGRGSSLFGGDWLSIILFPRPFHGVAASGRMLPGGSNVDRCGIGAAGRPDNDPRAGERARSSPVGLRSGCVGVG